MIDLILIRGLPSSGKTTLANLLLRNEEDCDERLDGHFESDQFFMKNGIYRFDEERIAEAHRWCYEQVRDQIWARCDWDHSVTVVSNTFSQRWEMQPYIEFVEMASRSVKLTVVDLFDGGCSDEQLFRRNKHGVPLEVFRTMRDEYEHDWRNGNPIPPWDRIEEPVRMAYVKVQGVKYGPYPLKEARKEADRLGGFITEN